jgi:hypothetical protein
MLRINGKECILIKGEDMEIIAEIIGALVDGVVGILLEFVPGRRKKQSS